MRLRRTPLIALSLLPALLFLAVCPSTTLASTEANLRIPDLNSQTFFNGSIGGATLLLWGMLICAAGLIFGLVIKRQLRLLPVHPLMREVSEVIYATCKTYLFTQGIFILLLWLFIGATLVIYFGFLARAVDPVTQAVSHGLGATKVGVILLFSLIGIAGSYSVAWFGIRVNTYANSRTALASRTGQ